MQTCAELTGRHEKVDVIRTDEVLCETNDCIRQRLFTMMIGRVFGDFATELRDFDLANEILREANEHDFTLARFETVHDTGNGPFCTRFGEENEFFVDEIIEIDLFRIGSVEIIGRKVLFSSLIDIFGVPFDPIFAIITQGAVERQLNGEIVFDRIVFEQNTMTFHV